MQVTEACRFLTPLPYLQHGVNDEDDDSSDSDNDNENDFDDNKHSSESICNTASDSTTGEYSDTCDPSDQLHSLPPLFTANAYQSISGRYSNRNFTNDYGGYEASAASVDIMELDSGDQSTSTQFSFQGNQRSLSSINFVNDDSTNYRPDCPNVITHNERSSTHDLLGYLAAALPTILVIYRYPYLNR